MIPLTKPAGAEPTGLLAKFSENNSFTGRQTTALVGAAVVGELGLGADVVGALGLGAAVTGELGLGAAVVGELGLGAAVTGELGQLW